MAGSGKSLVSQAVNTQFRQLVLASVGLLLAIVAAFLGSSFLLFGLVQGQAAATWLPPTLVAAIIAGLVGLVIWLMLRLLALRSTERILEAVGQEIHELRTANHRAKALQAMASTLRVTLSFEPVVESALDVCSLALEEAGIPSRALVGAVFLYKGDELLPVASRRLKDTDLHLSLYGEKGIVADALKQAETTATDRPDEDPELGRFYTFRQCESVICVPLRAGFHIYGAMILGLRVQVQFTVEQLELFTSVADQVVIALQNAELYQQLEAEKQRIVETEEEARKELARDLHDGPTQSVAAIVMRINFVSTLLKRDPRAAVEELKRIEELAKETSKEIRGMLFTLRPLILDSDGLAAAIEQVMARLEDMTGIDMELVGGEYGELLNERAQGVVFYIVEEALGNASKHSAAERIEVRMWREDGLFVASVKDDGKGFDVQAVNENYSTRGSLGMVNMKERADLIDGTLRVESSPGQGTAITLIVPLDKVGREVAAVTA